MGGTLAASPRPAPDPLCPPPLLTSACLAPPFIPGRWACKSFPPTSQETCPAGPLPRLAAAWWCLLQACPRTPPAGPRCKTYSCAGRRSSCLPRTCVPTPASPPSLRPSPPASSRRWAQRGAGWAAEAGAREKGGRAVPPCVPPVCPLASRRAPPSRAAHPMPAVLAQRPAGGRGGQPVPLLAFRLPAAKAGKPVRAAC